MYSSLSSGTDHIFFPPRLELVAEQKNPDGFPPHLWHQLAFHRFFGNQPDGPPRPAFRRVAADHGDDALARFGVQQTLCPRTLFVIQGAFQPGILLAPCDFPHRLGCQMDIGGHLGTAFAFMKLAQSQTPQYDAHRLDSAAQHTIQLITVALFQLHMEASVDPHAPLCSKTFQDGIVWMPFFKRSEN